MSRTGSSEQPETVLRTNQILSAALTAGPSILLVVLLVLRGMRGDLFGPNPLEIRSPLLVIALCLTVGNTALSWIIPGLIEHRHRQRIASEPASLARIRKTARDAEAEEEMLLASWTTSRIVGLALLEGAAFLAGIVYFLEGNALALLMAVFLIGAMVVRFPTADRLRTWLDGQVELLREERID